MLAKTNKGFDGSIKSLDSTGFCVWVLPLDFSVLKASPPVSQLTSEVIQQGIF